MIGEPPRTTCAFWSFATADDDKARKDRRSWAAVTLPAELQVGLLRRIMMSATMFAESEMRRSKNA